MKQKKVIIINDNSVSLYGGRKQEIKYTLTGIPYVNHYSRRYRLDYFLSAHNMVWNAGNPWKDLGFDGFNSDSFFSGLLIKFDDNDESARVYTYIT